MEAWLQGLLSWVSAHPTWAGAFVFLISMAESLAIVGVVVPGVAMMFAVGALIAADALAFWPTMAWAVAGAVAGDGLSFWLGYHFRERLTGFWPFNRHPAMLERGVEFFQRYGGKSVAFGRFVGPVRAVIPLVAGMLSMPPGRFLLANVVSALAWAPAYLLPGIVFGASLELASEVAWRLVVLILVAALLVGTVVWTVRTLFRALQPHAASWVAGILRWSELHPKLGEIAAAITDPGHPEGRGLAMFASLLVVSTLAFVAILTATVEAGGWGGFDYAVYQALQSLRTPWADHLFVFVSRLADGPVVLAVVVAVGGYHAAHRRWRNLLYWLAAASFAFLAPAILKPLLQVPRPDADLQGVYSYAFPSGHALRATVIYGFLAVELARGMSTRWRWLPYAGAGLIACGVALARCYLGVHWLSDVIGSLALGSAWVAALGVAMYRHTSLPGRWITAGGLAVAALVVAMGTLTWSRQEADLAHYQPAPAPIQIAPSDWWEKDWARLPSEREDLRRSQSHPLTLQVAGGKERVVQFFLSLGWERPVPLDWRALLRMLSSSTPIDRLPVLPQVHAGRHDAITLTRQDGPDQRMVLRLWPTQAQLEPSLEPLWIGSVSRQSPQPLLGVLRYAATESDFVAPLDSLAGEISGVPVRAPNRPDPPLLIWLLSQVPETRARATLPSPSGEAADARSPGDRALSPR